MGPAGRGGGIVVVRGGAADRGGGTVGGRDGAADMRGGDEVREDVDGSTREESV